MRPLKKLEAVPTPGASGLQDPVEPPGGAELLDPPGELGPADPVGELPAGLPALRDFEYGGPEAVAVAHTDIFLRYAEGRDIFPEEAGLRKLLRGFRVLPSPPFVVVVGVVMDRLIRAPVMLPVRLGVPGEALEPDVNRPGNRLFADGALLPLGPECLRRPGEEGRYGDVLHGATFYTD